MNLYDAAIVESNRKRVKMRLGEALWLFFAEMYPSLDGGDWDNLCEQALLVVEEVGISYKGGKEE